MSLRLLAVSLIIVAGLAACAAPTVPAPTAVPPTAAPTTAAPAATQPAAAAATEPTAAASSDLTAIKTYLLGKTSALKTDTAALAQAGDSYYILAKDANFDYTALWTSKQPQVVKSIQDARAAWKLASPTYEQMEGIVAGVESLSQFDVDLDAGTSGSDPDAVSFDLTLPDGKVLPKPGNLFGVTEGTLWGSRPEYTSKVVADLDGNNSTSDLGDVLPDAKVLKSAADLLNQKAGELDQAANAWQPTPSDAFGALVGNVPTVGDFFESWKNSRFVSGAAATETDFVVISRLSDIIDNVSSWQAIYGGVSSMVSGVDSAQDEQIKENLTDLKEYVNKIYGQEQGGKKFTPEEADTLSVEAQNRATAIAGALAQVAAKLNVQISE